MERISDENVKTSEILIAARGFIDTPDKWTRHVFARDVEGSVVDFDAAEAVCFCTIGALNRAERGIGDYSRRGHRFLRNAMLAGHATRLLSSSIVDFNDDAGTNHAMVLKVFDDAISAAKSAEATREDDDI